MSTSTSAASPERQTETVELYVWSRESASLADIGDLAHSRLSQAAGLCYSPAECVLIRQIDNGWRRWCPAQNRPVEYEFEGAYEVRLFSEEGELRWLNDPAQASDLGSASFVSDGEQATSAPGDGWVDAFADHSLSVAADARHVERVPNRYLLWGSAFEGASDSDWACLATGRIGRLHVPVRGVRPLDSEDPPDRHSKHRVLLNSFEYIGLEPGVAGREHGNTTIVAERLVGFAADSGIIDEQEHGNSSSV